VLGILIAVIAFDVWMHAEIHVRATGKDGKPWVEWSKTGSP